MPTTCVTNPGQPYVPTRPAYVTSTPSVGWNAGANTARVCARDCYFQWELSARLAGAVVGIGPPNRFSANFVDLTHAVYASWRNGSLIVQPMESGQLVDSGIVVPDGTLFYIQRLSGVVEFRLDGDRWYVSPHRSSGAVRGGAVLYTSGDRVI